MPTTPVYALPYPSNSDDVDVSGDMQSLAEAVDTALGSAGGGLNPFLLMGA